MVQTGCLVESHLPNTNSQAGSLFVHKRNFFFLKKKKQSDKKIAADELPERFYTDAKSAHIMKMTIDSPKQTTVVIRMVWKKKKKVGKKYFLNGGKLLKWMD